MTAVTAICIIHHHAFWFVNNSLHSVSITMLHKISDARSFSTVFTHIIIFTYNLILCNRSYQSLESQLKLSMMLIYHFGIIFLCSILYTLILSWGLKAMASSESQNSSMASLASQICSHIASIFSKPTHPHPPAFNLLVAELSSAAMKNGKVFLYGVGREGLMLKALCMRLAHLGLSAHLVFDMTTPPITTNDLLIASAGPGGFSTVDALCSVVRSHGARVLLLTAQPETGSCVKHASVIGYVPAQTMAYDKGGEAHEESRALLPMGSVYEGALFVLFEMVVYRVGEALEQTPNAIRARHTNLE